MQTFFPGVYFQEVEFGGSSRPIQGVDMSVGAVVGYFEKGEIGVPVRVTSFDEFQSKFGGPIVGALSWYAVDGFFKNGGKSLWVVRTVHYTDVTSASSVTSVAASLTLNDSSTGTLKLIAKSHGKYGEKISAKTTRVSLASTQASAQANVGATQIALKSTRNIYKGSLLTVASATYKVTSVDHNAKTVNIQGTVSTQIALNAPIVSNEFDLFIYYNSELKETFKGLSMVADSERYVEAIVNNPKTGSTYVDADDLSSATVAPNNRPVDSSNPVSLSGGNDGLTGLTSNDLIGSPASKTGIYAFDYVQEAFNLFIVESTSDVVMRAKLAYCELRMDAFTVGSVPAGSTVDDALAYRLETGNFNSSYGALYYSHGYVNDPIGIGASPEILVPLDGHILGMYARSDRQFDLGQSPAGEHAVLFGVNRLEHKLDDTKNGILNMQSVNCVRSLNGAGIVVWGTRTLSSDPKWKYIHARRLFIYAEKSIMLGTRWAVFKPTITSTYKAIERTIIGFLTTMPGLAGETKEERFAVVCDESINTQAVKDQGRILTKIGLNIQGVGEFIVFEIGQIREGASITE